jgi:plasmid replication initiation protein
MVSKDVVKYHNDVNRVYFSGLNTREWDLFLAVCGEVLDKGTQTIIISFETLRHKLKYRWEDNRTLEKYIKSFGMKVNNSPIERRQGSKWQLFWILRKLEADYETKLVEVKVSEEFEWVLNELTGNFTLFSLAEFIKLRSKYAKAIYRLCRQWSKTQNHTELYDIDDFKARIEAPKKMTKWHDIERKCIKPAFKELRAYFGDMTLHKRKIGRRICQVFISFEKPERDGRPVEVQRQELRDELDEYNKKRRRAYEDGDYDLMWHYIEMINMTERKLIKLNDQQPTIYDHLKPKTTK